jgi:hypothetical protein
MLAYFAVRWLRNFTTNEFISYYLTDLLFVPAMCTFALIGVRFIKRKPDLLIPGHFVLLQTIFVSFYFEWYLPEYHGKPGWYTSDIMDVLMYILGATLFILIQRFYLTKTAFMQRVIK